jgi:HAD superfamily hydrolase (TIGR01509 family)
MRLPLLHLHTIPSGGYIELLRKGLLFDFDGLVLDTETPEVRAWEWMFAQHNLEYPKEVWQSIVGRGPDQISEKPEDILVREAKLNETPERVYTTFRARYFQILEKVARPGVEKLIAEATALGYELHIVSSSEKRWVEGHLNDLGLREHFQTLTTRDEGVPTKPAPDLYLRCLEKNGLKPKQVWALEDSANGLAAAKAAGIKTLVCPNPTTEHLDFSKADKIVLSLEEVTLPL